MEWKDPKRFEGGGKGSYQETKDPAGYCVTFTIEDDGRATLTASFRNKAFALFYVDSKNKVMSKNAARAMRVACGLHNESQ